MDCCLHFFPWNIFIIMNKGHPKYKTNRLLLSPHSLLVPPPPLTPPPPILLGRKFQLKAWTYLMSLNLYIIINLHDTLNTSWITVYLIFFFFYSPSFVTTSYLSFDQHALLVSFSIIVFFFSGQIFQSSTSTFRVLYIYRKSTSANTTHNMPLLPTSGVAKGGPGGARAPPGKACAPRVPPHLRFVMQNYASVTI